MANMDLGKIYEDLMSKTAEIDEKLDSLTDTKAAGKRATINKLIAEAEDSWKPLVDSFQAKLGTAPEETMLGVFYGITRGLSDVFGKQAAEKLDEIVNTLPEATPLISPEEVPALQKLRSEFYAQIKATINLAEQFYGASDMVMPRKRTGSKGPRGKRALSFYTFYVEDKEYANLKAVIEDYTQFEKVSALTAAIKEVGENSDPKWNLTEPPEQWEFTLPDGKILVGKDTRDDSDEGDDEDEDEVEE